MLRIHDILGWILIRICGSMPLTNGSEFGSGSWIRILLFSSLTFKMPAIFSAYYFLKLHLHHFSKIKSQKESQNNRNHGFFFFFCSMIRIRIQPLNSESGSGSVPLTSESGSGSGRPKTCGSGGSESGPGSATLVCWKAEQIWGKSEKVIQFRNTVAGIRIRTRIRNTGLLKSRANLR